MCGIAGIIALQEKPVPHGYIKNMTRAFIHRGPDAEGYYEDREVHLGSRRLSILDVKNGNQPIYNEDKTIVTVFNGEIYNYRDLKKDLQKTGHVFETNTDTEVLVHLYEEHGEKFVGLLKGQFAFAVYDKRKEVLILGRDRTGICPLYYAMADGFFYFCSEIKSLSVLPGFYLKADPAGIVQALTYWSTIAPRTIFKDVLSLPTASYLVLDRKKNALYTEKYHTYEYYKNKYRFQGEKEICDLIRSTVTKAVERRLVSDASVKTGAYLSGGLDSTILAYSMQELTGEPLHTYSVAFENQECDESKYQADCRKDLKSCHKELLIRDEDIVKNFEEVLLHTEFPFFRTAPIPMFLLSKEVQKDDVKVILSGEGSDEIFYGYDSFKDALFLSQWAKNPESKTIPLMLKEIHPETAANPAMFEYLCRYYKKFLEPSPFSPLKMKWENGKNLLSFLSEELREQIPNQDMEEEILSGFPKEFSRLSSLRRCQELEMEFLLNGYLLSSQGDRVLCAHSVEGRYPFLDEELIEIACNIPDSLKLKGWNEKYILREAYKGIIPESIRTRKKFPYHAPASRVFLEYRHKYPEIQELLSEEQIKRTGIFDYGKVKKLLEKYTDTNQVYGITSREDLLVMFLLGTQGVFNAAKNRFLGFSF